MQLATVEALTQFLFLRHEPAPVDVIVVLGCPSVTNMDPAVALFRAGLTARIVITGRGPAVGVEPEWSVYRRYARAAGIPEAALLIEPEATNTKENFVFTERILARDPGWAAIRTLAVSSKPFHARRAYMTARRCFPKHVELRMLPPQDRRDVQAADWWTTEVGRERVLSELRRIAEYSLIGDLSLD